MTKKNDKEMAVQSNLPVDLSMFEQDSGSGMEGTTSESFAIPFLSVLQKGSPQVDEASGQALEGAKAGMFFDSVTQRMFDGKAGILFIPCAYKRVFIQWGPKDLGGGFKGELLPEDVAKMRGSGALVEVEGQLYIPQGDGSVNEKRCDVVKDVRNHFGLLYEPESGVASQVLLSLSSTQIKKSKMLMGMLASVKLSGSKGMYTPPTFANVVKLTSVPESNDKGSWFGVRPELHGQVDRSDVYLAAKAFHDNVIDGKVGAKYETEAGTPEGEEGKF
jgi:hypothetical protein